MFFAVVFEDGLFLPVFKHLELGRDVFQLFLDLGKEGFERTGLRFIAESQLNAFTQQGIGEAALTALGGRFCRWGVRFIHTVGQGIPQLLDFGFQLRFVEEVDLMGRLFAAGGELLSAFIAQQLFEDLDALLALF